jgi:hypothetical protein
LQFEAARTRPYTCVAVGLLSKCVAEPLACHWDAAESAEIPAFYCVFANGHEGCGTDQTGLTRRCGLCDRIRLKVDQWICDKDWTLSHRMEIYEPVMFVAVHGEGRGRVALRSFQGDSLDAARTTGTGMAQEEPTVGT